MRGLFKKEANDGGCVAKDALQLFERGDVVPYENFGDKVLVEVVQVLARNVAFGGFLVQEAQMTSLLRRAARVARAHEGVDHRGLKVFIQFRVDGVHVEGEAEAVIATLLVHDALRHASKTNI